MQWQSVDHVFPPWIGQQVWLSITQCSARLHIHPRSHLKSTIRHIKQSCGNPILPIDYNKLMSRQILQRIVQFKEIPQMRQLCYFRRMKIGKTMHSIHWIVTIPSPYQLYVHLLPIWNKQLNESITRPIHTNESKIRKNKPLKIELNNTKIRFTRASQTTSPTNSAPSTIQPPRKQEPYRPSPQWDSPPWFSPEPWRRSTGTAPGPETERNQASERPL